MVLYMASPDYVMRHIAGDNVLIKTRNYESGNANVFVFNDTGAFLWEELSERRSRSQLVTLLTDKYGITQAQAEQDVELFINKCIAEGFVFEDKEGA